MSNLDSEILNIIMAQLINMNISLKMNSKTITLKSLPDKDLDPERDNRLTGIRNGKDDSEQTQKLNINNLQHSPSLSLMVGQQMDEDDESNSLDFCPHCSSYVENGISCNTCELWFHYQCECLDPLDGYGDDGS